VSADRFEEFDAAFVLGALDPAEQAEFELHLEGCPDCRARVDELLGLAPLLAALPETAFTVADPPPPDGLLLSLQREVRRGRNRRRWYYASASAAAAAVLILATTLLVRHDSSAAPVAAATATFRAMANPSAAPLHVDAAVTTVGWGTRIDLRCSYDPSVTSGEYRYGLVVVDTAGASHDAGSWKATPGRVTKFTGGSSLPVSDIAQIEITMVGTSGPLLTLSTR
jgi:hypothetical protein